MSKTQTQTTTHGRFGPFETDSHIHEPGYINAISTGNFQIVDQENSLHVNQCNRYFTIMSNNCIIMNCIEDESIQFECNRILMKVYLKNRTNTK